MASNQMVNAFVKWQLKKSFMASNQMVNAFVKWQFVNFVNKLLRS